VRSIQHRDLGRLSAAPKKLGNIVAGHPLSGESALERGADLAAVQIRDPAHRGTAAVI
jgi:hypothetical protein